MSRKGHLATLAALSKLPESERRSIKYVCAGPADDKAYEARIVATAASLGVSTVLAGALPARRSWLRPIELRACSLSAGTQCRRR